MHLTKEFPDMDLNISVFILSFSIEWWFPNLEQ